MKKLDQRSPARCSIESGSYTFQYVSYRAHLGQTFLLGSFYEQVFIYLLTFFYRLSSSYLIQEGVCYLTLSDRSFPKRLAFVYLEEIHAGFVEELERDYGGNWRDIVTTVARPYAFIKFGTRVGELGCCGRV